MKTARSRFRTTTSRFREAFRDWKDKPGLPLSNFNKLNMASLLHLKREAPAEVDEEGQMRVPRKEQGNDSH